MYRFLNHLIYSVGEIVLGVIFIFVIIFIWISIQEGLKNKNIKKEENLKKDIPKQEIKISNINNSKKLQDEKINSYCTFTFFEKIDKMFENINKIYPESLLIEWQNNKTECIKSIEIDKKSFESEIIAIKRLSFYIINFQNGIKNFITDIKEFDFINKQFQKVIYIYDEDTDILYELFFSIIEKTQFYSLKIKVKEIEE